MLLPRTLTKKKGNSNNIENPFLVSYRFLQDVPQKKNCKSFFRCNRPPIVGVLFLYFLSHQLWQMVELLDIHSKKPMEFLSILEQVFMFIGCTHMFRLLRHHLLLHIIACKTSMLKFSIPLEFFTCSLFKGTKKPLGLGDLIGLDSVGVNTPWL